MNTTPLIDRIVCLSELSKDLKGELRLTEAERQKCRRRDCLTLETVHQLDLEVSSHDCDSMAGTLPAQLEAFEVGGASAGAVTMSVGQNTPEILRITGTAIDRAVITAPQDETLLLRFCFEPAA